MGEGAGLQLQRDPLPPSPMSLVAPASNRPRAPASSSSPGVSIFWGWELPGPHLASLGPLCEPGGGQGRPPLPEGWGEEMGQSSGAGWKGHAGSSHIQRQPSLVRLSPCSLPQCAPGPTSIPPLRLYLRTGPRARAAARGSRSASRQYLQQSILCEGLCHSLGLRNTCSNPFSARVSVTLWASVSAPVKVESGPR